MFFILPALCFKRHILDDSRSLFGPPVDENGKSPRYRFEGEYVSTSYSSDGVSWTQLGYKYAGSTAYLISSNKTESGNFKIDYRLQSKNRTNSQFAVWGSRSDEVDMKMDFYGRSNSLDGFIFVFDLNSNGLLNVMGASGSNLEFDTTNKSKIFTKQERVENFTGEDGSFIVRVEKEGTLLKLFIGKAVNNMKFVLSLKMENSGVGLHMGISARHGSMAFQPLNLMGIRFYDLKMDYSKFNNEDVPRGKLGKLFWLGCLMVMIVIVGYLYTNYSRFERKEI